MRLEEPPRPKVSLGRRRDVSPVAPGNQHGVPPFAAIAGRNQALAFGEGGDEPADGFGANQRLIDERDDYGGAVGGQGRQTRSQRGTHPASPIGVVHRHDAGQAQRDRAGDDDHRIGTAVP